MAAGFVEYERHETGRSKTEHKITTNVLRQWQLFKDGNDETLRSIKSFTIFLSPPIGRCPGGVGAIFTTTSDSVYGVGHNCSHINIMGFHPDCSDVVNQVSVPRKIDSLSGKSVKTISIGNLIGAAITCTGTLLWWGSDPQTGSVMVPNTPKKAVRRKYSNVVCGDRMMVALSISGNVFVWGLVSPGLPLFDGILIVMDVAVKTIACGYHHVAMIDANGLPYTWGAGEYGQRGIATFFPDDTLEPKKVMHHLCRDVKCGPFSTFFLTKYHEIVACGYNGFPLSRNPQSALTKIEIREPIDDIDVAWNGNGLAQIAATTVDGEIYVWGPGEIPALTSDPIVTVYSRWVMTPGSVNIFYAPLQEKPKPKQSKTCGILTKPQESGSSTFLSSWVYEIQRSNVHFYNSRLFTSITGVSLTDNLTEFLSEENGRNFIMNKYLDDLFYEDQDFSHTGEQQLR